MNPYLKHIYHKFVDEIELQKEGTLQKETIRDEPNKVKELILFTPFNKKEQYSFTKKTTYTIEEYGNIKKEALTFLMEKAIKEENYEKASVCKEELEKLKESN